MAEGSKKGKEGLKSCLEAAEGNLFDCLFATLQQAEQAPDEELPSTGVSLDWERKLSPLFIQTPDYGTRSSAVLLRKKGGYLLYRACACRWSSEGKGIFHFLLQKEIRVLEEGSTGK
ncbi:hypothetical protein GCM10020331_077050 [Ectobacillus funiculus]